MQFQNALLTILLVSLVPYITARGHGSTGGGHHARSGGFRGFYGKGGYHYVSARHAHYSYHPPQHINYMCRYCSSYAPYPVYHAPPPAYVYKYRESSSPFGYLLAGLALYNLGRATSEQTHYTNYYHKQSVDEDCSMQVKDHKSFEETRIPCFMVSTFMERAASEPKGPTPQPNQLDITSSQIDVNPFINTTGSTLQVTTEQECVIWHNTSLNKEHNTVPCALLKKYSETLKSHGIPVYIWLPSTCVVVLGITLCCQCCFRKKRKKEEEPLNDTTVLGYSSYCP